MISKFECPVCGHILNCSSVIAKLPEEEVKVSGPLKAWCYGPSVIEIWLGLENLDRLKYYEEAFKDNKSYHPLWEMNEIND